MASLWGSKPEESLQEYANARMDREIDEEDQGSRTNRVQGSRTNRVQGSCTEDVNLSHTTYVLRSARYERPRSSYRETLRVLNITDDTLAVVVLPLSYENETLGSIYARLAISEPAQICWSMDEAAKRDDLEVLHHVDRRNDLIINESTNVTVSDVLLVVSRVDGDKVNVLDVRRVSATKDLVLAVLPGLLEEGGQSLDVQPGKLMETIMEEVLDHMRETRVPEDVKGTPPQIKVHMKISNFSQGRKLLLSIPEEVTLDARLTHTVGSIRGQMRTHVENEQDMYICHIGRLLGDECVLSDLEFCEYKGLSAVQECLVLSMYLLPGRAQGRLSYLGQNAHTADTVSSSTETEISITRNDMVVCTVKIHPLSTVRHLKIRAIQENIGQRQQSTFYLGCSSCHLEGESASPEDESAPLDFYVTEFILNESKVAIWLVKYWVPCSFSWRPWSWERLVLPLAERNFSGKDVNDFDVRTFKTYSAKTVFVNRTSVPVHISCFPTWSNDRTVKGAGFSFGAMGVGAGLHAKRQITTKYHPGYAAVEDPCLGEHGAFEVVNIPEGMARDMSVVFGVRSADGSSIEYKRVKNVKSGQQVDVLEAFVNKPPKYTHPIGQPSMKVLAEKFLPKC